MKRIICMLASCFLIVSIMASCSSYKKGYREGYEDGYNRSVSNPENKQDSQFGTESKKKLPYNIIKNETYELDLIDVYVSNEKYTSDWPEEEKEEQCYVFKFKFTNKHKSSNIRIALVNASINGYSIRGSSGYHSDDSFSVYTWGGTGTDNTSVDCFRLFFSDIQAATNIRDAAKIEGASLSFIFRAYIIDEMDDYGDDVYFTIDDAFQYCS